MKVFNSPKSLSEDNFLTLVNQLNTFMTSVGVENMNGQIIENVLIPASASIDISHNLKVAPKYRIILRQIGGGSIIDGDSDWTDSRISLKNTGASDSIVTVFLIRS